MPLLKKAQKGQPCIRLDWPYWDCDWDWVELPFAAMDSYSSCHCVVISFYASSCVFKVSARLCPLASGPSSSTRRAFSWLTCTVRFETSTWASAAFFLAFSSASFKGATTSCCVS